MSVVKHLSSDMFQFFAGHCPIILISEGIVSEAATKGVRLNVHKKTPVPEFRFSWSNGVVVKALDYQSRGLVFKITEWLQSRLSHSSFRGR